MARGLTDSGLQALALAYLVDQVEEKDRRELVKEVYQVATQLENTIDMCVEALRYVGNYLYSQQIDRAVNSDFTEPENFVFNISDEFFGDLAELYSLVSNFEKMFTYLE